MKIYESYEICDLHTHSSCSDGSLSPELLIKRAVEKNLSAIALTDHNTVLGLNEFLESAKKYNITAVPGIEFSTEYGNKELHIVGLFIKNESFETVNQYLAPAQKSKEESNERLLRNLKKAGYEVEYEEVKALSSGGSINRACIASYLMNKGYIKTVKEGFKTILSPKAGYYIPPERLSALKTISFIKSIGGVAVLAHPFLDMTEGELEEFLPKAKAAGLTAMETRYSTYDEETQRAADKIAEKFNLLASGGSDYHGATKPDIELGTGKGNLKVPIQYYLDLLKCLA